MEKNEKAAFLRRQKTICDLVKAMRMAQRRASDTPFTFPDMWLGDSASGMQASFQPSKRWPGVWRGGC